MKPVINTIYGKIQGIVTENAYQFRGIPYAKAPVGALRFHAPVACDSWEGILEASKFKAREYQQPQIPESFYVKEFYRGEEFDVQMSEDCLHLNIWMPREATTEGKEYPVAVWFHGGAFLNGYSFEKEFSGEEYAKRGVILVTVNYRLGLFGFFAHPELRNRDGHSGNYGLLDQIAAIGWVRENIEAFGGDKNNITIFGQSAGAYSVRCLVSSPLTKGKIHKAIIQSCGGYGYAVLENISVEKLENLCVSYLQECNLTLDEFMKLPAEQLGELSNRYTSWAVEHGADNFSLIPETDGYVLTDDSDTLVNQGKTFSIPYLVGCTKDDIFVSEDGVKDPKKNVLYNAAIDWCKMHNQRGISSYAYYFSHDLPGDDSGAFHSSELWYMFGTLNRCWRPFTEKDIQLSNEMVDAWTEFMKTGDPGWEKCTEDNAYVKEFRYQ